MAVKGNQTVSEKELEEYEGAHHRGVRTWVITMPEIGHLCSAVGQIVKRFLTDEKTRNSLIFFLLFKLNEVVPIIVLLQKVELGKKKKKTSDVIEYPVNTHLLLTMIFVLLQNQLDSMTNLRQILQGSSWTSGKITIQSPYVTSQNHRIAGAGRDLQRLWSPTSCFQNMISQKERKSI